MSNIICSVFPVCILLPSTSNDIFNFWKSGNSSFVTIYGPIGPKVSKPFPLSHVNPLFFWKFLSLTSFTRKKPKTWSKAFSTLTLIAFFPITKPNSTSQSVWLDPLGTIIGSLGPVIQLVNLENIIGSLGNGKFCSLAWSLKFNPIPINFDGLETQAPILKFDSSLGSSDNLIFSIFLIVLKFNVSGLKSSTIEDKSR